MTRPEVIRTVEIELLRLDVAGCGRCDDTHRNLRAAVALLAPALEAIDVAVVVRDVPVTSAQQATEVRLISSPTIRIDGHDIAGELAETGCADCTAPGDGGAMVGCRVWRYHGREHIDAPVGLIVGAVLRHLYCQPPLQGPATHPGLSGNLQAFFGTGTA